MIGTKIVALGFSATGVRVYTRNAELIVNNRISLASRIDQGCIRIPEQNFC